MIYKYKVLNIDPKDIEDMEATLNELGLDGWRLVSVVKAYEEVKTVFFFVKMFVEAPEMHG